jgi:hypothetical protein
MAYITMEALHSASDLTERDVDLPSIGGTVRVRGLPGEYSAQAQSEALEMVTGRKGEQTARVNTAKLEKLQVLHGLIEPKPRSMEDVEVLAKKLGPAWRKIVEAIDEISGIDKEAIEKTNATFQDGGAGANGSHVGDGAPAGSGGSALPV